jgi:putative membrane protein
MSATVETNPPSGKASVGDADTSAVEQKNEKLTPKRALEWSAYGFSMGTANVIPGVSGGTMALIHGIYERLIDAIRSVNLDFIKAFFTLQWKKAFRILDWRFIFPLGFGVLLAVVSLARVIPYLLEHHRAPICAFFMGLILASAVVIGREIDKWSLSTVASGIVATVGSFILVGLLPLRTPADLWFIFLCGAISIMAMLLPGISGAFMLLVLGKYAYILQAVRDLAYRGQIAALLPLGIFCVGCAVGLIGLARVLGYLLHHYRPQTMAALGGLMLGSLRKLWPWREVVEWTTVGKKRIPVAEANRLPDALSGEVILVAGLVVVGVVLVAVLERIARYRDNPKEQDEGAQDGKENGKQGRKE